MESITTVLHEPQLLILDEPQSGLDPVNQEVLRETIELTRAAGRTVVLSTHNMTEAEAMCDAVCIIASGRKVLDGPLAAVRRENRGYRYRLRVEPGASQEALAELRVLLERASPGAAGTADGAQWEVDLTGRDPRSLLAALATLPVELERFERVQPSLHEIFLQHAGRAHAARREAPGA